MIVCHCNVVNDREIRRAIETGAETVVEVTRACGAGGRCGSCTPAIEALLEVHAVPVLLRLAS